MAEFTPWALAQPRNPPPISKVTVYARDPYNFSWRTPDGTIIPAVGPNAAGATNPTSVPTIQSVEIIPAPGVPDYGVNGPGQEQAM